MTKVHILAHFIYLFLTLLTSDVLLRCALLRFMNA